MLFSKHFDDDKLFKYKWYTHINYITYGTVQEVHRHICSRILGDGFWSCNEKEDLRRLLLGGINVHNWEIHHKYFGQGEHLDLCVIYKKGKDLSRKVRDDRERG